MKVFASKDISPNAYFALPSDALNVSGKVCFFHGDWLVMHWKSKCEVKPFSTLPPFWHVCLEILISYSFDLNMFVSMLHAKDFFSMLIFFFFNFQPELKSAVVEVQVAHALANPRSTYAPTMVRLKVERLNVDDWMWNNTNVVERLNGEWCELKKRLDS